MLKAYFGISGDEDDEIKWWKWGMNMLLRCAGNFCLIILPIPRPIFHHSGPALCPKDWPLLVASLGWGRQASRWIWPIEGTGRRWERKVGERSILSLSPPCSWLHFLTAAKSLQDHSSCQRAPPLWLQLSHLAPVMLFLFFAPLDLAVIRASRCCWFLGDRNPVSPLTLPTPLQIIPS